MKKLKRFVVLLLMNVLSTTVMAALPPVDAPVITLKTTCAALDTICFSDTTAMLTWVWDTRKPTKDKPLLINVDPGVYVLPDPSISGGRAYCEDRIPTDLDRVGYVTIKGSGRSSTVLTGGGPSAATSAISYATVTVIECDGLVFQDLTIRAGSRGGQGPSIHGVSWFGGGTSIWTNVRVEAEEYGWIDEVSTNILGNAGRVCDINTRGLHYWYASEINTVAMTPDVGYYQFAYRSMCGETWFYGGEISATTGRPGIPLVALAGVEAEAFGQVNLYGTAVRVLLTEQATIASSLSVAYGQTGLFIGSGGVIHMHGGLVSVLSLNPGLTQDVYGIKGSGPGIIHAPETAYDVRTVGGGIAYRTAMYDMTAHLMTPFLWPASANPPTSGTTGVPIASIDGFDMFVESDCSAAGCNDNLNPSLGTETHLLVYASACTAAGPWLDQVTGHCRGQ